MTSSIAFTSAERRSPCSFFDSEKYAAHASIQTCSRRLAAPFFVTATFMKLAARFWLFTLAMAMPQ